jgi:hypothetical protein
MAILSSVCYTKKLQNLKQYGITRTVLSYQVTEVFKGLKLLI